MRNVQIILHADTIAAKEIVTDRLRLKQILFNLIGNALKFTEHGKIEIFARAEDNPTYPSIVFEVRDTGIGMSEEAAAQIFNLYHQGDGSTFSRFGGTGIGLTLSRQIAESLGGTLELVESELGKGSRFCFKVLDHHDLDVTECPQPTEGQLKRQVSPQLLNGARILVVDDSSEMRHLFTLFLKRAGAAVDVAENGQAGTNGAAELQI